MALLHRIIPVLLVNGSKLVKTIQFKREIYLGDPVNTIKIFNDKEVDEIIVLDITATEQKREPNYNLIRDLASECFMPVCYGGGITNLEQVKHIFSLGIEKVSLNTSAIKNPLLISDIAKRYGNQAVVVSMDYKKNIWGNESIYIKRGHNKVKTPIMEQLKIFEQQGAGEVLINSIDRDGTYLGYDVPFLKNISNHINIPIIACGGASSLKDMKNLMNETSIRATAAGSLFVFSGQNRGILINYPTRVELDRLLLS